MSSSIKPTHPIITGAPNPWPEQLSPARLEFRDLVKDKKQFSLYVQALERMMKEPYENDYSHVSIGGIHGLPYNRWGDSGPVEFEDGDAFGGYCTHGSMLFPTWHRPYVALYEQVVWKHANEIAKGYPADWQKAALTLRQPYWDWALTPPAGTKGVPEEITTPKISILTPTGEITIKNPLYSYKFLAKFPVDTFAGTSFSQWDHTVRYPTSDQPDAKSDDEKFKDTYYSEVAQIQTQVFNMMTRQDTWPKFSNHTTAQDQNTAMSLESIHDNMHLVIGGVSPYAGHMADIGVAGFDAAFFLHHSNVDRLLSLWIAMHPKVWVTPGEQPGGTYTITNDGNVDVASDLTPFWNSQSTYWKSSEIHSHETFHYSYPEFQDLNGASTDAVRKAIWDKVTLLYGNADITTTTATAVPFAPSGFPEPGNPSSPTTSTSGNTTTNSIASTGSTTGSTTTAATASIAPPTSGAYHDWTIHLKYKKHELGRSFRILVSLGDKYVGAVSAFVSSAADRCANCQRNIDADIEGFVHINQALVAKFPGIGSLSPDQVRPILAQHLSYRIEGQKPDGTPAALSDLPSLKVAPFSQVCELDPTIPGVPRVGPATYHHDVLVGKPGHVPEEQWATRPSQ
ncbi:Di-copper centre-containing protein [Wolfiporia cocos MD-104 SS10]|uniref:tyrosinase n=1 Tax=Wolfiporia cocos (strain MD-104) TaxID=742152 RepID=A0A2H3J9C6_WOLCO|nr:Di-copper centre-containing protein [Wolfiporia cocos MD-104 SS10]